MKRRTLVVPFVPGPDNSGPTNPLASSALYTAAAALSAGDDAAFSMGALTAWVQPQWEWQAHGHHDAVNGRVHVMGKPANDDESWAHRWYDIATNAWTSGGDAMWNNFGHIYGNFAIDPLTGDLFQVRGALNQGSPYDNPQRARWWKHSLQDWSSLAPSSQDIYSGALADIANGAAFHPNLYGTGDGGLIVDTQFRFLFWRKSTDGIQDSSHGDSAYGNQYGIGLYWPNQDCAIVGGAGGNPLAKIVSNGTGVPTVSTFATPPIGTAGQSDSGAGGFGSLHVDPTDATKLILVERGGSYRWWTASSAGTFTRQDTTYGAHPFQFRPFVVVSIPAIGALWALGFNDTGSVAHSRLWKPDV